MFVNNNKLKKLIYLIKISKLNIFQEKKYINNYNFNELKKKIKNKKIALVGNSKNLLKKNRHIDNYDIVIRINLVPPSNLEKYLGKRCNILMLSHAPINLINNNFIKIWMSPKNRHYTNHGSGIIYHYPIRWWKELYFKLKSRPSTGAMALDFLTRVAPKSDISLIGFDHKYENVWYNNIYQGRVHDFKSEKFFFSEITRKYNVKYIK